MMERPLRLGDVVEDYCPRCRLLLNHDVASLSGTQIAKTTCRTCFDTHDYRHGELPRRRPKKQVETQKLMDQVLAGLPMPPATPPPAPPPAAPVEKRRDLWAELDRIRKK